ncbi:14 kDa proline-rich protein DC2.15-like [Carex rostrata]
MAIKTTISIFFLLLTSSLSNAATTPSYYPIKPTPYVPRRISHKLPPANPFCPRDAPKLGACLDLLGGAFGLKTGASLGTHGKCCSILDALVDAEAAACLCTTIKESVLGITTEWSVAVSLLVSSCKKDLPDGFKCV